MRARDRYGAVKLNEQERRRRGRTEMEGVRAGTRETGLQETPACNFEHSTVSEAVSSAKIALDG